MIYSEKKETYIHQKNILDKKIRNIGNFRLLMALVFFLMCYYSIKETEHFIFLIFALLSAFAFVLLLKIHINLKTKSVYTEKLIKINEVEIAYLSGNYTALKNGLQYLKTDHLYVYDLDIFGNNSLFQHLNRTISTNGEYKLADSLNVGTAHTLQAVHTATQELSDKFDWRQSFAAQGMMMDEKQDSADRLLNWAKQINTPSLFLKIIIYLFPLAVFSVLTLFIISDYEHAFSIFSALFMLSFMLVIFQLKNITKESNQLNELAKIIFSYSKLIDKIEKESFDSEILNTYKSEFNSNSKQASDAIHRLSVIINQLESVNNVFALFVFNGFFMYHLHILYKLYKWKNKYAKYIESWINSMAFFDYMNSLANFHYNHPEFSFPTRSNKIQMFKAKDLGHPLIHKYKRVCNDIYFDNYNFIILTGSNMSGKSTFLRSIGINLVLMKSGAVVCAKDFISSDFTLFTSMRVNDSLSENESYFYAELKRLHQLIELLKNNKPVFVILDEILRGTNSNDKRVGTEGLIQKIIKHSMLGIIATHDLSISNMKENHKGIIETKCFEVEIKNNDLYFDYKLRDGVCVNKSATFLMQKMSIID